MAKQAHNFPPRHKTFVLPSLIDHSAIMKIAQQITLFYLIIIMTSIVAANAEETLSSLTYLRGLNRKQDERQKKNDRERRRKHKTEVVTDPTVETTPDPVCPIEMPNSGDKCSDTLSCQYEHLLVPAALDDGSCDKDLTNATCQATTGCTCDSDSGTWMCWASRRRTLIASCSNMEEIEGAFQPCKP